MIEIVAEIWNGASAHGDLRVTVVRTDTVHATAYAYEVERAKVPMRRVDGFKSRVAARRAAKRRYPSARRWQRVRERMAPTLADLFA